MSVNTNLLADRVARREGKKKISLNAAQARETLAIVRDELAAFTDAEIIAWVRRGKRKGR